MALDDFLTIRTAPDQFPVTNALQQRIAQAINQGALYAGMDGLVSALAYAVLEVEVAMANARAENLNLKADLLSLKAYVLELESRALDAGVELGDPGTEL